MADRAKVLILGAGLVSKPIIEYFLADGGYDLTVASLDVAHAEALVNKHPRGLARQVDVCDETQVEPLIGGSDLVISLVPYAFHVQVAKLAIRNHVPMVTTSYVSPQMRALDGEAREAGVLILNEIGLDPGIDHLSSMRQIDRIRRAGGVVEGFASCTGGLPAPEAADNPWRYKFSWSPRGALLAGTQSARYLRQGRVHHVPGADLFSHFWPYEVEQIGRLEMYPNRDSLRYVQLYGLDDVEKFIRGTIRYPGWCETMKAVAEIGLLDVDERHWPPRTSYADMLSELLPPSPGSLRGRLASRLGLPEAHDVIRRFEWSGLISDERLPETAASPLDAVAALFERRMAYRPGERDMVVMRHEIDVRWADDSRQRMISLLVAFGDPQGDSATARTVSLPAAIASRSILEGGLDLVGVQVPTMAEVYEPILAELERLGIRFREWTEPAEDL